MRHEPALPGPLFRTLRARVDALGDERLARTYETTFWYDLGAPSAWPERAIGHLRGLVPADGIAGAEWWLSRMWTHDVRVDFHRDRDEALARRTGRERRPRLSSVLFLDAVEGGALAVTRQAPDPANPALCPLPLDAELVAPRPNRFVWFDGRRTHGVLDARNQVPAGRLRRRGELRRTLVVNWWARRPEGVPAFVEVGVYAALALRRRS